MTSHDTDGRTIGATARAGWRLERHVHGRLDFVAADGSRQTNVDVLRAFPVTAATGPVAIVAGAGGELAWIDALADEPADLRTLLESELAQREFLPVIERIDSVSDSEPPEWTVLTDRGPHRFKVDSADDIAHQSDGGAFVSDTHGVRYWIPNVDALDGRSRRLFEKML
ncbi:MAG: DUF1854 domain-containing protein [Planctomycetota bacterium]|jgi:hypothetical protein|nr:MAG: DUF1854 domain-containing protein [Planctomycetota bacterium]